MSVVRKILQTEIAISLKYDGYQRGLLSLVYNFFYEKTESGAIATSKVRESVNEKLSQELHKLVIKNFKRRKVYASFKDNIRAADSADMGSLPCFNHDVKFLLCVADFYTKYALVQHLEEKKAKTVLHVLLK